ncbi:MAG: hypothetical protein V3V49_14660 [Candidatus Krumholzibacteria bacterium]
MLRLMITLSLVALLVTAAGATGEKPWFDMENCAMCKGFTSKAGLMENVTWEHHDISNGILSVTVVNEKYLDAYRAAHAEMDKTVMLLQKGEMVEMCGSCTAIGACMMKGAKQEYVETSSGDVWIVTSDKAEVVAELQSWAKRSKEETAKMKATKG